MKNRVLIPAAMALLGAVLINPLLGWSLALAAALLWMALSVLGVSRRLPVVTLRQEGSRADGVVFRIRRRMPEQETP